MITRLLISPGLQHIIMVDVHSEVNFSLNAFSQLRVPSCVFDGNTLDCAVDRHTFVYEETIKNFAVAALSE